MDLPPEARKWDKPDPLPLDRVMAGFLVPSTLIVVSLQGWQDPTDPMPLKAMKMGVLPEDPREEENKPEALFPGVNNNKKKLRDTKDKLRDLNPAFVAYLNKPDYDYKVSQFYWAAHQPSGIEEVLLMGVDLESPEASWFLSRTRPFLSPVANGAGIVATEDIPLKWLPEEAAGYGLKARCFGYAASSASLHVMCGNSPEPGSYYCATCISNDVATRDFVLPFSVPEEFPGDEEDLKSPGFPGMYKNARFLGYYRGQLLMWKENDEVKGASSKTGTGWILDKYRYDKTMESEGDDYKIILEDLVCPGAYVGLASAHSTSRKDLAAHVEEVKNTDRATGIVMGRTWSNWAPFVNDLFMRKKRTKRPHLLYTSTSMVWQIRPIYKGEELDVDYGAAYTCT